MTNDVHSQNGTNYKCPLPFRYPGGKYYALGILEPFWQSVDHDEYREPFVGGGSVFFNKPKASFNWVNDLDEELMITYRTLQQEHLRNQLISMVENEPANKSRWREIFEFEPKDDLEIAYRYYYLNRTSFSGKMVSPGWGYRPKRSLPPERWHERIIPAGNKLESVICTNVDFSEVIKEESKGENVLMYIDPPYYSPPKRKHYRHGFDTTDHERLCATLMQSKHKFFLTYDDEPVIRDMYKWANIYEASFFYRVDNSNTYNGSRRTGFELIITNYEVNR
jgi:DNA adenine methylase